TTTGYNMKTVSLRPRACYRVTATLHVSRTLGGTLFGNDAVIKWFGDDSSPAFLFSDNQFFTIQDLTIQAGSALADALVTENAAGGIVPTGFTLERVTLDGQDGKLGIGYHAALGSGGDANNDVAVLADLTVKGFTRAAVKFDHSQ